MTQTELDNLVTELKCCQVKMGGELAANLAIGDCDISQNLVLLNGYISAIELYDLDTEENNCIDETIFLSFVAKAKTLCKTCDCNN